MIGAWICPECGNALPSGGGACAVCGARSQLVPPDTSAVDELETRLRSATAGDYEIRGRIGQGGMAAVYLARDLRLNRRVAIKVMLPELSGVPTMAARFNREAQIAAGLSHPNIIVLHSVESGGGLLFLVMSLVEGCSLDLIVREVGALPVPLAQLVLQEVAHALHYAHDEGVIHRDVKPGNVLLDVRGRAVVTDFGIARAAEAPHLTQTGAAIGTPAYMSPEQCMGREATAASDQYSLGVVAYELLTGARPFTGATLEIQWAHATEPPRSVASMRTDCPPAVAAAVMRMLEKRPEDRWPSLREAGLALADGLTDESAARATLAALARARAERHLGPLGQTPASPVPRSVTPPSPVPEPAMPGGASVPPPATDTDELSPTLGAPPAPHAVEQDSSTPAPVGLAVPSVTEGEAPGERQATDQPAWWARVMALLSFRPRLTGAVAALLVAAAVLLAVWWSPVAHPAGGDVTTTPQPPPTESITPPVVDSVPESKADVVASDSAPPSVESVELLVPAKRRRLSVGSRIMPRVRVRGVGGDSIGALAPVEWTSSDSVIAQVAGNGVVTGRAPGTVTITATLSGVTGRVTLTVVERRLRIRTVPRIDLVAGDSVRLDARVVDANMDDAEVRDRVVTVATSGLRHVSYDSVTRYVVGRSAGEESLMLAGGESLRLILPVRVRGRRGAARPTAVPSPTRDEMRNLAQHVATLIARRQRAELERLFATQIAEGSLPGVVDRVRKSKVTAAVAVGDPVLRGSAGASPTVDLAVRYRWSRKLGFGSDNEIACLRAVLRRPGPTWEFDSIRQIRCAAPGVTSAPADSR